eukprot:TRINITY_DN14852_c0_g1_i1.p1 TRINITY_DN14852_c0_g1~~TRINITY_DN14852_c0_g1_i1.p1  ORF type:complete len:146 (-),score=44.10 TRINITY_DN14852_c0_g1_i1:330-767(-)
MPTRSSGPVDQQDWAPVVVHKRGTKASEARDPKAVNAAIRAGADVLTIKKFDGGTNKKEASTSVNARKLDQETEPAALEKVSTDVRHAIQKARIDKKLTQAQLAQQINERPQVVQEYEAGKAVPNQQVLGKLERVLGVKLRGKLK